VHTAATHPPQPAEGGTGSLNSACQYSRSSSHRPSSEKTSTRQPGRVSDWPGRPSSEAHPSSRTPKRDLHSLLSIAEIVSRFDVVALQEAKDNLKALRHLLKVLGPNWVDGREAEAERELDALRRSTARRRT
jgi:hypothetical protein